MKQDFGVLKIQPLCILNFGADYIFKEREVDFKLVLCLKSTSVGHEF